MANISWGKPKLLCRKIETGKTYKWREVLTPVEGTTNYATTKGDKLEAKFEGGDYADIKYKKNTGALTFDEFVLKGQKKPFADVDGVIEGEYEFAVQPEDATVPGGLFIKRGHISVEPKFTSEEGTRITYTVDTIAPQDGSESFKIGTITVTKSGEDITAVSCAPLEAESDVVESTPVA